MSRLDHLRVHHPLLFVSMQKIAIWKGVWTIPGAQWVEGLAYSVQHGIVPLRLALWLCTTAIPLGFTSLTSEISEREEISAFP